MSAKTISAIVKIYDDVSGKVSADKPYVVGPRQLTYGQLFDRVGRLAAVYQGLGLVPGDRAAIISEADTAVIPIFVSLLRCGVTAVIMNPGLADEELRLVLATAEPKAVFIDRAILERIPRAEIISADAYVIEVDIERTESGQEQNGAQDRTLRFPASLATVRPLDRFPDDLSDSLVAYVLFTSGTTSRPKGVEITHRNLFAHMSTMQRHMGIDGNSRLLDLVPLHHAYGLIFGSFNTFTVGGSLVRPFHGYGKPDQLPRLLNCIAEYRVTLFATVPTTLTMLLPLSEEYRHAFRTLDFKFVMSASSQLESELWEQFEHAFGTTVVNVYGMTEVPNGALYCGPTAETRRVGTAGKSIGCLLRIVDEDGSDLPPGEIGELLLGGPQIMKGYFRMPEETAAVMRDGWLCTGDLAVQDENGFYRFVGRKKNMIICGGLKIYPDEVTKIIRAMLGVFDAVTFGVADKVFGERAVSCVVPLPDTTLTSEQVAEHLLSRASPAMMPSEIHIMPDLPRSAAGKIQLGELKRQITGGLRQYERLLNPHSNQ